MNNIPLNVVSLLLAVVAVLTSCSNGDDRSDKQPLIPPAAPTAKVEGTFQPGASAQVGATVPLAVEVQHNVMVPMRDGVNLAADVYLPDGPGPFPVLLVRTPYDKGSDKWEAVSDARFYALNEELSREWPVITEMKDSPQDADDWRDVKNKFQYLEQ